MAEPVFDQHGWCHDMSLAPRDGALIELTAFDGGEQFETWTMRWAHIQRNGLFPGTVGMWTTPGGNFTWNGTPECGGPTAWRYPQPPPVKEAE